MPGSTNLKTDDAQRVNRSVVGVGAGNAGRSKADSAQITQRVNRLVVTRGVRQTARMLGLSPSATVALAAGAPVRVGTLAQARERFAELALSEGDAE